MLRLQGNRRPRGVYHILDAVHRQREACQRKGLTSPWGAPRSPAPPRPASTGSGPQPPISVIPPRFYSPACIPIAALPYLDLAAPGARGQECTGRRRGFDTRSAFAPHHLRPHLFPQGARSRVMRVSPLIRDAGVFAL